MNRLRVFFGLLVVSGLLGVAGFVAYELQSRLIISVRVAGDLWHTSRSDLEAAVAEHITASLYRVDVDAIREAGPVFALGERSIGTSSLARQLTSGRHRERTGGALVRGGISRGDR